MLIRRRSLGKLAAASGCAAVLGLGLGRWLLPTATSSSAAQTTDEAESSTET